MPQSADPKQVGEMAKALIEFNSHHLQWECPNKIFLIDWQFIDQYMMKEDATYLRN